MVSLSAGEVFQGAVQFASLIAVVFGVVKFLREREIEHASMISSWLDVHPVDGVHRVRLQTRNDSRSYATDFHASVFDLTGEAVEHKVEIPGLRPTGEQLSIVLDVPVPDDLTKARYGLMYEFTDVRGKRWRHEQGRGLFRVRYFRSQFDRAFEARQFPGQG
jgi:hypothetical protein